jgi:predicted NBD/HSP70 family sugar kinase
MTLNPLGNRELIRAINRSSVLNTVRTFGPISRTDTARHTRLSAATVSGITAELIEDGLIFEKEAGNSRGGRRPILLALNPRGGYTVGVKLSESQVVGALTDLEATVIASHTASLDGHSLDETIDNIARLVDTLLTMSGVESEKLLGVGVGLAGIIDPAKGVLRYSSILGWRDVPIGARLQERVHVPVYVGNDVDTLTLTEKWFGAGQGLDNFLTVTIGRGVGLGIVVNGQIYRGSQGGAGEFGHTVIDVAGPTCDCGNRGCLETFVADPALVRMAGLAVERGDLASTAGTVDGLLMEARAGNPAALSIFRRAGEVLGLGIANLINIFSPQRIIVSGEGVRARDLIFGPMREAIDRHVMPGLARDTEVEVDIWNDDAWARGAAGLVLQELFESPVRRDVPATAL